MEQTYRDQIVAHYNHITLTGLPERQNDLHRVPLDKVFVKLNTQTAQSGRLDSSVLREQRQLEEELYRLEADGADRREQEALRAQLRLLEAEARRPQTVTLSVAEALHQHRRLVIVGGPGSGKTTLSRWLTLIFAQRRQAESDALGPDFAQDRLPILLELRRFASFFEEEYKTPTVPDLTTVIANYISSNQAIYGNTPASLIQAALQEGRAMLILDGVDEIANLGARQELTDAINAFLRQPNGQHRENLMLITSRPHGYREVGLGHDFQSCEVQPFSAEDVALFIRHWYATAYADIEYEEEAQTLIEAIQANERVTDLATNPLLCTIIAIVYRNNRVLPNRRVELYEECCKVLLYSWEHRKDIRESGIIGSYNWRIKLDLLIPLTYHLYQDKEQTAVSEDALVAQLAQELESPKFAYSAAQAQEEAHRFITAIRDRSGILQGRGDGTLEFAHRSFQEYLAARYIAAQPDPAYIDLVMPHLHEEWWRDVHLLVIGYLGAGQDNAEKASKLLLTILKVYRPPWWIWRTFSIDASVPNWLNELGERFRYHRILERPVYALRQVWLLPFSVKQWLACQLPTIQLEHRLAWAIQREFELTTLGYLDCTITGCTEEWQQIISKMAENILLASVHDPGRHEENQLLIKQSIAIFQAQPNDKAVRALLNAFADSKWPVRQAAASSIGMLGQATQEVVKALIGALADSKGPVRQAAASSLGKLSHISPEGVRALIKVLADSDSNMRQIAASSLGKLGQATPEVVRALVDALDNDDSDITKTVTSSLVNLGQTSPEVVEALLDALDYNLDDPFGWYIREAAAFSLGALDKASPAMVKALMDGLGHCSKHVREAVAPLLVNLGQVTPEVIITFVDTLNHNEWYVRQAAASSLGDFGQAKPKVIRALVNSLNDSDFYVREAAASSLGTLGYANPEVIKALRGALSDYEHSVRQAAAATLGDLGQAIPEVVSALVDTLRDSKLSVRQAAASSLVKLDRAISEAVRVLMNILDESHHNDPDSWIVIQDAALSLGRLGEATPEVVKALVNLLDGRNVLIEDAATSSLIKLGQATPEVAEVLVDALLNSEGSERHTIAHLLGTLGQATPKVVTALVGALNDSEGFVRLSAISSLVRLDQVSPEIIKVLLDSLVDSEWYVRQEVASVLGDLDVRKLDEALWHQILIALNRNLHNFDDSSRQAALEAIRSLVKGRQLPGYHWHSIGERQARQKRRRQVGKWLGIVAVVLVVGTLATLFTEYVGPENFWVRLAGTLGVLVGVAAGIAQVLGRDLNS